jgi:polyketide cyclase/dehydrase/lipid transport protein
MRKALLTALFASCSLAVLGSSAEAASLVSGKKLEVKVDPATVDADRKALWEKYGGWCAIAEWHPAIAKCEESKEGDVEFRTLTMKDGGVIKEKLLDKGTTSYRYAIVESPLPVQNYEAQFSIVPDDDDLDEINIAWSATYDAKDKPDKDARSTIDGIFKSGLDNIKALQAKAPGAKPDDDDDDKK